MDAVVRNIAPQQKANVAEIDRAFGPSAAGSSVLDAALPTFVGRLLVEAFDGRIGIAPIR
jgi:hypothetical protein